MTGQSAFHHALLDPAEPVPAGLLDGHGGLAGRRYAVYRNNVAASLTDALRTGFPVIRKLLGDANFDRLAGLYLRAHPPRSPLMMHYGGNLPDFLTSFAPLRHIGYLADVARLELALRRSYHAADARPFDPGRLEEFSGEDLARARIEVAPSLEMVRSRWPLYDIWRFNTLDGAPKPQAIPQSVLITRREFDPEPHPLTLAQAVCLEALFAGKPMAEAVAAGEAEAEDFDLEALLTLLISNYGITDLTF